MTAEEKCRFCKSLIRWAKYGISDTMYMEEKIYAVKLPNGVALVEARSQVDALEIVNNQIKCNTTKE